MRRLSGGSRRSLDEALDRLAQGEEIGDGFDWELPIGEWEMSVVDRNDPELWLPEHPYETACEVAARLHDMGLVDDDGCELMEDVD